MYTTSLLISRLLEYQPLKELLNTIRYASARAARDFGKSAAESRMPLLRSSPGYPVLQIPDYTNPLYISFLASCQMQAKFRTSQYTLCYRESRGGMKAFHRSGVAEDAIDQSTSEFNRFILMLGNALLLLRSWFQIALNQLYLYLS